MHRQAHHPLTGALRQGGSAGTAAAAPANSRQSKPGALARDAADPMQLLGACAAGLLQKTPTLEKLNSPAPPGKLPGNAQTIDAATDHANMAE